MSKAKKKKDAASPLSLEFLLQEPPGRIIQACIQTKDRSCLLAVNGGGIGTPGSGPGATALTTDVTSPGAWEVFTINPGKDYSFTLQTSDGSYVTAVGGGGKGPPAKTSLPLPILTNGKLFQSGTVFHIILLGNNKVHIATPDLQHYLSANNGGGVNERRDPIRTNARDAGENETLELVVLIFSSSTHNGPP